MEDDNEMETETDCTSVEESSRDTRANKAVKVTECQVMRNNRKRITGNINCFVTPSY